MVKKNKFEGKVGIVRCPYFDYNYATVDYNKIGAFRWDNVSGGVKVYHKGYRIYGYIDYEVASNCGISCSGRHSSYNSDVKVCVVKKYTDPKIYKKILEEVGNKPQNKH